MSLTVGLSSTFSSKSTLSDKAEATIKNKNAICIRRRDKASVRINYIETRRKARDSKEKSMAGRERR